MILSLRKLDNIEGVPINIFGCCPGLSEWVEVVGPSIYAGYGVSWKELDKLVKEGCPLRVVSGGKVMGWHKYHDENDWV